MKRRDIVLASAGAALTGVPGLGLAQQTFPKPGSTIKYVVPFTPGGLTDMMARTVAQKLSEAWKTSVIVENKAGGNAQIGAEQVAKSAPDGNTVLAITLTHAANVSLYPNAPYSLTKDLRPVALLANSPMLVVVPTASPIKDFKDLMAVSKTKQLSAGSSGNGTPAHLTMALFNELNKTKMIHVPYRGGAPSMVDLIGGQLDVVFSNYPESIAHVKGGKLRAIAICSLGRHPGVPDVPTALEAGMPGLFVENWTGAMLPAKTPDDIVDKFSREMIKIMYSAEVEERAKQQGFRVSQKGSDEFGRFLKSEIDRWSRIIKTAKITPT
ncbi:tripartite tricarboxylate transporter substrate binding protein [Polaromonas sp. JS666]|uniref:Bug family tripartite tricarboxylate transporter substrate binding protein n=1 Tax=Polaromonas sp. (strain JS666 / ATCC BAA-500) TaxID=296591 RepID=UPI0008802806|nr:tripartite tricarboxylate transporter substrate binding protein [Polaromonas sp. JS666]SDN11695.1 Tripartite-type tricarboxylate transporter, receptor component TctC [Polaromonas sp. JS666]